MWIHGLLSRPPASSSSTRQRPDSLSRPATAQPADPAPVTMKSKVSSAVVILCSSNAKGDDSEANRHREGRAELYQSIAAVGAVGHLTAYVRPCPSLLRCQRDQARFFDPGGAADPEHPG